MPNSETLETLDHARCVADYAMSLGIGNIESEHRVITTHLGAALADSALQAGLNYKTVVRPRIERIIVEFPHTAEMAGIRSIINTNRVSDFLQWRHHEKISRFISLSDAIEKIGIQNILDLRESLSRFKNQNLLLQIPGIGPKTVDYLCCLAGIDCIPVDRHVKFFVNKAGVATNDYHRIKLIVSFAADLLGVSRRGFDSWMWNLISLQKSPAK